MRQQRAQRRGQARKQSAATSDEGERLRGVEDNSAAVRAAAACAACAAIAAAAVLRRRAAGPRALLVGASCCAAVAVGAAAASPRLRSAMRSLFRRAVLPVVPVVSPLPLPEPADDALDDGLDAACDDAWATLKVRDAVSRRLKKKRSIAPSFSPFLVVDTLPLLSVAVAAHRPRPRRVPPLPPRRRHPVLPRGRPGGRRGDGRSWAVVRPSRRNRRRVQGTHIAVALLPVGAHGRPITALPVSDALPRIFLCSGCVHVAHCGRAGGARPRARPRGGGAPAGAVRRGGGGHAADIRGCGA